MIIYAYAPYGSKCFLNQSVVAALPCKDGSFPANLSQTRRTATIETANGWFMVINNLQGCLPSGKLT
jgi:hypothetical protein